MKWKEDTDWNKRRKKNIRKWGEKKGITERKFEQEKGVRRRNFIKSGRQKSGVKRIVITETRAG